MKPEEWERLFHATRATLTHWIDKLRAEARRAFPEKVTAFRPDMAAHGRYGEACPRCGQKILRIRYADNETNYCARCQTGGKVSGRSRSFAPFGCRLAQDIGGTRKSANASIKCR